MKPPLWLDSHGASIVNEVAGRQRALENAGKEKPDEPKK